MDKGVAVEEEPLTEDGDTPRKAAPLFLFYSCKTSGSSFMKHKLLNLAIHCWPYDDHAPVFFRRINHMDRGKGLGKGRAQQPVKGQKSGSSDDDITRTPAAVHVIEELLQWIDSTVDKASAASGLALYPVLIAHWGETFQFLFLFRMLEKYGIDALETLGAHNVHFADPVPTLKQYKDARHPWLIDSRSLGLGSLLNDWFPAQFHERDLYFSRSCGALVLKLYTQSPLYWLLYRVPIFNTQEWVDFYKGEKLYQEDKWELQENLPSRVVGLQRKLTVKQLLKHGYSWSALIDLYKSCGSPHHFRQELRDIDVKTGPASQITIALAGMKLEQDGSREYKVRIKSNMQYVKYYHLTDPRGRHFILRVANVLPPIFFKLSDLCDNTWQVPDNLLRIGPPETWNAMLDLAPRDENDNYRDENVLKGLLNLPSGDSSEGEWDKADEDNGYQTFSNSELPDCYFREPAPAHVPTTLVKGVGATNPFAFPEQDWLAVDSWNQTPDSTKGENCSSRSPASGKQLASAKNAVPASDANSVDLCNHTVADQQPQRLCKSLGTNCRNCKKSRRSTAGNHSNCKPAVQSKYSTSTNQRDSSEPYHSTSSSQTNRSEVNSSKLYLGPSNQSSCNSSQTFTKSNNSTSSSARHSVRSHQSITSTQVAPQRGTPDLSSISSSEFSHDGPHHNQGAVPKKKGCPPPRPQSKKKSRQPAQANEAAVVESPPCAAANHGPANGYRRNGHSSTSSEAPRDEVFHAHKSAPARTQSKNGRKQARHES
ncbi:uncharacterized protein LOC110986560 isoform X2 [Acanthaster planci]|uniref:Uncharacterized protein LOC110986560 isoform X2 n=1 Tax=Acanthaster planci TaxID=133434 RepID=A0A8B7ZH55_ACAPL|nr:uncharacterized protein LOC110986560 isoform X2 [Acanthaster planci]